MNEIGVAEPDVTERSGVIEDGAPRIRRNRRPRTLLLAGLAVAAAVTGGLAWRHRGEPVAPPPPPPQVTVSAPLQQTLAATSGFLGQFSAVNSVELRAQVGGTLTEVAFKDGQIVHSGDLLFAIDPRPFQIRLDQSVAQLKTAEARVTLAESELWRAQQLKLSSFGTVQSVDQRAAELRAAQAAIDTAKAAIRDAQLDLEFSRIVAPFTGRIGARLVSMGSLVSGSRGGVNASTLLTTVVSLDPIYLDFDMSEADYRAYQQSHPGAVKHDDEVAISLDGDRHFDRQGRLDFIDNAVNRSSGTIHARVTVANPDLSITPGQFARLRVATGSAAPALLVPAAAVIADQARELVMTIAADGTVAAKQVETGGLHQGLRIVRRGLEPTDQVITNGLARVRPGMRVEPVAGTVTPDPGGDSG
ncbi:MAG TPA: efflux RND transporter periplasmic adaptor subunit [Crenalkalicoccus sp.]|jgi:RND family efflux transporter MFP subunit|nr:efflux RND transporter periplasmic adaptor subunit [Crenalkalicoccus sp.]